MKENRVLEKRDKKRDREEGCGKQKTVGGKRNGGIEMGKEYRISRGRQLVFWGNVKKAVD